MDDIEVLASRYAPIISQLPTLCALKNHNSQCIATTDLSAQLIGYKNSQACIGIYDYDMRCDAVALADTFIKEDQEVLKNGRIKQLYFSKYSNGEVKILVSVKDRFRDVDNSIIGVFAQCQDVTHFKEMQNIVIDTIFSYDTSIKSAQVKIKPRYDSISLTRRESQIFFYLIRKQAIKLIALKLNLSARTVEKHVENIMLKLACRSSEQLRDFAKEQGLTQILIENFYCRPSYIETMLADSVTT